MTKRADILEQVLHVEALPAASMRVLLLLQNPDSDQQEIASLVRHEPTLAANVLKLVNSVMFAGRKTIDSVDAALIRLGRRNTLNVVVASSIGPVEQHAISGNDMPAGALWRHGVAVAYGTRVIADVVGQESDDRAFTAGLLVDIGKYVLGHIMGIDGQDIAQDALTQGISFLEAERSHLGIDHAETGAALLNHWGLPDSLVEAVRWHHEPDDASAALQHMVDLVHASDQVCTIAGIGVGLDGSQYQPSGQALDRLQLTPRLVEKALSGIADGMVEAEQLLSI